MKILERIRKQNLRRKYNLDEYMKDVWLAAGVHMDDKPLPPVFDEDGKYIDLNIGDILPMIELPDGKFAYYKVIAIKRKGGSDWLYATDGYDYDLKFNHVGEFKIRWEQPPSPETQES